MRVLLFLDRLVLKGLSLRRIDFIQTQLVALTLSFNLYASTSASDTKAQKHNKYAAILVVK